MASKYAETPPAPGEKRFDIFISHCKRIASTEDRALWMQDTFEEAGMIPFFDRSSLDEISKEQLERDVLASRCLVTILDPETFNSDWVVFENETALTANVPIQFFYDGDMFSWPDLQQWKERFPKFFMADPIEYHKAEHKECRKKLIDAAKALKHGGSADATNGDPAATGGSAAAQSVSKTYDTYVSHCRRIASTGDRALWIQDAFEEAGLKATFDRESGEAEDGTVTMDRESIRAQILASKSVVTVLDTETFTAEQVVFENQVAADAGIPIIPFFDADTYRWTDVSHWTTEHEAFFKIPAVEYHRSYHKQAKQLLISKAKGEKIAGANASLDTLADVLGRSAKELNARMRELNDLGTLPVACGKLCRMAGHLGNELGTISAEEAEDDGVNAALGKLRDAMEYAGELVEDAARPPPKVASGGGGLCGGSKPKAAAVAPEPPPGVVEGILKHEIVISELRSELRTAAEKARAALKSRIKKVETLNSTVSFWKKISEGVDAATWDETQTALRAELEGVDAAKAVGLVPLLKSKLCGADGKVKLWGVHV